MFVSTSCESVKASNGVNIGSRMAAVDVVVVAIVIVEDVVAVVVEFCVNAPCMMMMMTTKAVPIFLMNSMTAIVVGVLFS